MPYKTVEEAQKKIHGLKDLPHKRQRQWMHVFNSCMKAGKHDEGICIAQAWSVAERDYQKDLEKKNAKVAKELFMSTAQITKQFNPTVLRLFQAAIPNVSRGYALYLSQVIDPKFVDALRFRKTANDDLKQTREAFADTVAKMIKDHKVPAITQELTEQLRREAPDKMNEILAELKTYYNSEEEKVAEDVRDRLVEQHGLSKDTGENIKNLINWMRAVNGHYHGAFIKVLMDMARTRAENTVMSQAEMEANLASNYAIETMSKPKNLRESPYIGAYLSWLKTHLHRRGGKFREQFDFDEKTTLNAPMSDEDESDGSSQIVERDNVTNLDAPELKDLVSSLKAYVNKNSPRHAEGINLLLDELLVNHSWTTPKDISDNIMPKLQEINESYKEHTVAKVLYPALVKHVTNYFIEQGDHSTADKIRRMLEKMRDSWFVRDTLERFSSLDESFLNKNLLKTAACKNNLKLQGCVLRSASKDHNGAILVYADNPEHGHLFACRLNSIGGVEYEMLHDIDQDHVDEAFRVAVDTYVREQNRS